MAVCGQGAPGPQARRRRGGQGAGAAPWRKRLGTARLEERGGPMAHATSQRWGGQTVPRGPWCAPSARTRWGAAAEGRDCRPAAGQGDALAAFSPPGQGQLTLPHCLRCDRTLQRVGPLGCPGATASGRAAGKAGGGDVSNGMTRTQRDETLRCAHVAPARTEATQSNVSWRERAGAMGGGTEASLRCRRRRVMTDSWVMAAMIRSAPRRQKGHGGHIQRKHALQQPGPAPARRCQSSPPPRPHPAGAASG